MKSSHKNHLSKDAIRLHEKAIVIGGHCDILIPLTDGVAWLDERMTLPDPTGFDSRFSEYFGPTGQYSLPQWKEGGVALQFCAIYIEDKHLDRSLQRGLEMVWALISEVERNESLMLVGSKNDLNQVKAKEKCGVAISLEGFDALGSDLHFLDLYYRLGVRMAGLTHNSRNAFGDGPQAGVRTGGLTDLGRLAIRRMNELGSLWTWHIQTRLPSMRSWKSPTPRWLSHMPARPHSAGREMNTQRILVLT